ncbi:Hypothetical protein PSM36_1326 [Proteiniphilum saccharofermentans]|jgi:hypothetical protein|uniref:Secretion system C-terminal sorting domain-containing protein n=1 Tax=Proteiniphilum saccharofermentans TaxID=1642647 RepID=A0A1R3T283_9BACT|nr:T9SS type A sorting domain-containing protein [Proteiniphilum saccharofermentans]SCD20149.1 Hypothetical protein PSM36_1326 [Proteiniphilum saccharofermentans]SEA36178.1 Por secretion system C-terminal sorting domain-containing protein [Porphyromonadaceae bacterium KH3R12]SFS41696.1 Por secretion system C-terminal sorting domain-containing protein [Porphyromonadaceae bacterium NLAE-zl-C104]
MKRAILLSLTLLLAMAVKAQQKLTYAYDAAGNRVGRTIVLEPRSASDSENPADTVFFEETLDDTQVRIYPNPVETQMTIRVSGYAPSMQGEYSLYNITGIIVAKRRITGETTLVDMGRYPKGIYILHIILNGQPTAWRVIKK